MEGVTFFDSFFVFFMLDLVDLDCMLLCRLTAWLYSLTACFCFFALSRSIFFWFTRASWGEAGTSMGKLARIQNNIKILFAGIITNVLV